MSASEKAFGCAIFLGVREHLTTVAWPTAFSRGRDAAIDQALLFVDSRLRLLRFPDGGKGFTAAKAGLDDEIRHRLEVTNRYITFRDQGERRRLHATDGDELLLALRLLRQRVGTRQIHAEQPVGP